MNQPEKQREPFARRVLISTAIVGLVGVALFLLWSISNVLLMIFAAILAAVLLHGLAARLGSYTHLSPTWSLTIVLCGLFLFGTAVIWLLAPRVAAQANQLSNGLNQSVNHLGTELRRYEFGRALLAQTGSISDLPKQSELISKVTGAFSATFSGIINAIIIAFVGFYFAANPGRYLDGVLKLLPHSHRKRVGEVMAETGATLYSWFMGRIILMVVNGFLTWLGLWLLGIPLALTLGILAGLLNFIPNIGPIIAGIPAVLIGLTHGPTVAGYVILLYLFLQNLDGYVFTPLVQERTVSLAPALTILAQVILGVLAGSLGLLLATPLTAAALVFVKRLYVEDVLGEHP